MINSTTEEQVKNISKNWAFYYFIPTCDIFGESIQLNLFVGKKNSEITTKTLTMKFTIKSISKAERIHCGVGKYHDALAIN